MSWLSRLANLTRRGRLDRDLDDELQFHLEARARDLARSGMSDGEARARAARQVGNTLVLREASRDIKLFPWIESIVRDIGFGLRLWRRNRTITAASILSLSLALGACTAAFRVVDALILRALPVDDPATLVNVALRAPGDDRDMVSFNYPLFERMRDASRARVRLFVMSDQDRRDATFDDRGEPEPVYPQWISGQAMAILGIQPALGRLLMPGDDVHPGRHPVAVISHDFWTRRFNSSPDAVGRWVSIRGRSLQIVGVAARGFTGVEPGIMTDLWAPAMMWDDEAIGDASTRWFRIWGRMTAGAAPEQARALLQPVFMNFIREEVAKRPMLAGNRATRMLGTRVHLRPAAQGPSALRESFARPLWILAGVAALVLLIAGANLASLLSARAMARDREMALRVSIGAGRRRLVQQVVIESALLVLASCALGALIADAAAPRVVSMLSTSDSAVRLVMQADLRLLAFLAAVGGLVTAIFGLAPALRASRISPNEALKAGAARQSARTGFFRPLVAAQTAFGFVVLFVAGLCLASFSKLARIDVGFDARDVLVATIAAGGATPGEMPPAASWQQLLDRVSRIPGVESAGLSGWGLFESSGRNKAVRVEGRPVDSDDPWYLPVSPGFLATMRIPLVEGRDFDWRDARADRPTAVIVNQSFARRYFPHGSPVGRRFFRVDGGSTLTPQDVIGVARDAKYNDLRSAAPPTVYDVYRSEDGAALQLRTRLDAGTLAATLREEVARVHPAFALTALTRQATLIGNSMVRERALAVLAAFFSTVAMVLVMVGLYGVLSYGVAQRAREIGIRLALGAQPAGVVGLVVSDVGAMAAAGLAIGAIGAIAAARYVQPLLYEVRAADVPSTAWPLAALLGACLLSALVPAWRATRVDPVTTLRAD